MRKKVLITAALPYANGELHFGHLAGAYLPADCYARFERLQGSEVLYICGSDEYGVAITLSAELAKRTPQEQVDLYHRLNRELFTQMNISFDHFSRTSWKGHIPVVQQFFSDLLANGYIEEKTTEQLFSSAENRFLADRYVMGTCPRCNFSQARGDECQKCGANYEAIDLKEPCSKITGSPLVLKKTNHWFLRFDFFKERLKTWFIDKNWKSNVINFSQAYIDDLKPRAITRDEVWGVPVPLPGTEGKVLYVWFDAPIGYISATKEWAQIQGDEERWKEFWLDPKTTYVQFIGKDNIPFHAIFFPCMIMGQNQPYKLVDHLSANEFLNLEGQKFSKSEGWSINLAEFYTLFTTDQIRYTLAANEPESHDAEFTWKDFQLRCNSELLKKYGNLVNRIVLFLHRYFQGKAPKKGNFDSLDQDFLLKLQQLVEEVRNAYQYFHLRRAASLIMEIAQTGNVYFDKKKPWVTIKESPTAAETTLFCCFQGLKMLALVSSPIIPETAQSVWEMIGNTTLLAEQNWDAVMGNEAVTTEPLPQPYPLFKKVEDTTIQAEEERLYTEMS